ncbi:MAG TPA: hypothetical protein VF723_05240, partial [Pyrinomonadaceae bacterium]
MRTTFFGALLAVLMVTIMSTQGHTLEGAEGGDGPAFASGQGRPTAGDFHWRGRLDRGRAIEIKGVNGNIRAEAATGDEVEVIAVKSSSGGNASQVQLKVLEHEGGVTICASYPSADPNRAHECRPGDEVQPGDQPPRSIGLMEFKHNDVQVSFTVRVPSQVRFIGRT